MSYKIFAVTGLFLVELNTIFTHVIDYIKQLPYPFYGQEISVPHNQISLALPLPSPSSGLMGGGIRLHNFVFKTGTNNGVTSIIPSSSSSSIRKVACYGFTPSF
jgi:hypothetical protein